MQMRESGKVHQPHSRQCLTCAGNDKIREPTKGLPWNSGLRYRSDRSIACTIRKKEEHWVGRAGSCAEHKTPSEEGCHMIHFVSFEWVMLASQKPQLPNWVRNPACLHLIEKMTSPSNSCASPLRCINCISSGSGPKLNHKFYCPQVNPHLYLTDPKTTIMVALRGHRSVSHYYTQNNLLSMTFPRFIITGLLHHHHQIIITASPLYPCFITYLSIHRNCFRVPQK